MIHIENHGPLILSSNYWGSGTGPGSTLTSRS